MNLTDNARSRTLLTTGALLFLIAMLSGLLIPLMETPRQGLSAHLAGAMSGTFLIAVGAAWHRVALPKVWEAAAYWTLLISSWLNWFVNQMGAVWGTGRLTPIAADDQMAAPWQETAVAAGLTALTVTAIVSAALLAFGFWRGR